MLGLLDRPSGGHYRLDGTETTALKEEQRAALRRDRIGFVFQAYNLIPVLTVTENVEYIMLLQGVSASERRRPGQVPSRLSPSIR